MSSQAMLVYTGKALHRARFHFNYRVISTPLDHPGQLCLSQKSPFLCQKQNLPEPFQLWADTASGLPGSNLVFRKVGEGWGPSM